MSGKVEELKVTPEIVPTKVASKPPTSEEIFTRNWNTMIEHLQQAKMFWDVQTKLMLEKKVNREKLPLDLQRIYARPFMLAKFVDGMSTFIENLHRAEPKEFKVK